MNRFAGAAIAEGSGPPRPSAAAAPNFDGLARVYFWMEAATFGPWLWRRRCAFLGHLGHCRRALALGDGDGRFTARLLATDAEVEVEAVDASQAMLRELMRRAGHGAGRVHTHCADVREWVEANAAPGAGGRAAGVQPIAQAYDLIVTHFFLDCLTTAEVRALAAKLRGLVSPSAVWLVSEFAVRPNWFGRLVARPLIGFLYWAFGLLTGLAVRSLPDYRGAMAEAGFRLDEQQSALGGLLVSELWRAAEK